MLGYNISEALNREPGKFSKNASKRCRKLDMRSISRQVRLSRWTEIIRQRVESGKSVRTWCFENGIVEKTYHYWKRQLREAACEELALSTSTRFPSGLPAQRFAEIKLESPDSGVPMFHGDEASHICIKLGEVHITADSAYSPEKMAILLRELLRPC